jgi:hypothetical protein
LHGGWWEVDITIVLKEKWSLLDIALKSMLLEAGFLI